MDKSYTIQQQGHIIEFTVYNADLDIITTFVNVRHSGLPIPLIISNIPTTSWKNINNCIFIFTVLNYPERVKTAHDELQKQNFIHST